ncbi:MAG: hypothetical protein ACI88H_002459 [Cocleimonas sp.]|jgi:hypothetical protein
MNLSYYNNISIGIIALGAVINQSKELPISKLFLIFPLLSHQKLLQHLGRKTTNIKSTEQLIVDKMSCFANFNKRYCDSLVLTVNALQYLNDMGYIEINSGKVILVKPFEYHKKMGKRAMKMFNASENIAHILKDNSNKLYLNLRVEI